MKRIYIISGIALVCLIILFIFLGNNSENKGRRRTTSANQNNKNTQQQQIKPRTINVYIENSGSMDGYVKGVSEFEQAVYNYLSDIKIAETADSLNLFYINSKIIPQGSVTENTDVLRDFIEKLEPATFKVKGGNRGTSDISDVLKTVMQDTKKNTISILVTDGIFSPGKGKDADQYLVNQQIGIKNSVSAFLGKEKDAAFIVYQLSSQFDGIYYNKVDAKIPLKGQRPFYIWVIGNANNLSILRKAIPDNKFNGSGVKNIFSIATGNRTVKYAINPSIGKFSKSRTNTNTTIEDLKKDSRTGKANFAINVDFSGLLLDDTYLMDANNYENNSKYKLEVKKSSAKSGGYSHILYLSADKVTKGTVSVKLKMSLPAWVESLNDIDGTTPLAEKTYGIKYQIGGVFEAFTFNNKYFTEIKVTIQ